GAEHAPAVATSKRTGAAGAVGGGSSVPLRPYGRTTHGTQSHHQDPHPAHLEHPEQDRHCHRSPAPRRRRHARRAHLDHWLAAALNPRGAHWAQEEGAYDREVEARRCDLLSHRGPSVMATIELENELAALATMSPAQLRTRWASVTERVVPK